MTSKAKLLWRKPDFKKKYDAVIIGGGIHGLAAAYYLAKDQGMTHIAVIEKNCIGYGASGRNTQIVRADQRTEKNIIFHREALKMWPELISELDYNLMFVPGILNIAHSEHMFNELVLSANISNFHGLDTEILDAKQCKEVIPELDISDRPTYPVYGGVYHKPGGNIRHDAVVWALAKGASKHGVYIHQGIEVTAIRSENNRIAGVETSNGYIKTNKVLSTVGGYSALIAAMVGLKLPTTVLQMQAMVSEPLKSFLRLTFVSLDYDVFGSQTLKGEIVTGSDMGHWPSYANHTTPDYLCRQASYLTEIFPCLKGIKFMRIWAGLTDMTPDMAAIMEGDFPIKGFYLDAGWGYFGFKSGPISGRYMAKYMALEERPSEILPFTLHRFENYRGLAEQTRPVYYGPWN